MVILLSCKEMTILLSAAQDHPPGLLERIAMIGHLATCIGCRRFSLQQKLIRNACQKISQGSTGITKQEAVTELPEQH